MSIEFWSDKRSAQTEAQPDDLLLDLVRSLGCCSMRRGCEAVGCGLCTAQLNGKPVLSCPALTVRVDGRYVTILEGLQKEAEELDMFLVAEGGGQCGLCSPGFIMDVLTIERELRNPDEESIREYLANNLCRCSGYIPQLRAIKKYLESKQEVRADGIYRR